jgi:TldD protein
VTDLLRLALDTAVQRGASYADARLVESSREDIHVKDGEVGALDRSESAGMGVRVLVRGGWGYAATDELTREGASACAARAVAIGEASAGVLRDPVRLAPEPPHRATWSSDCSVDPFSVPLERKLDLLTRCSDATRGVRRSPPIMAADVRA